MNSSRTTPRHGENQTVHRGGRGHLFIVSAPSGAGKTTLCQAARQQLSDIAYSVSHTTRSPRRGERNGVDYYFIDTPEFEKGIQDGRWAEWARVHGQYYGTSAQWIQDELAAGRNILMDIDVEGARQMVAQFPGAVTIFIIPPSLAELERRLRDRGTDDSDTVLIRLRNAETEMANSVWYRYQLINDNLAEAERKLVSLIKSHIDHGDGAPS